MPYFNRSVYHGGKLCPSHKYWLSRIFRPSYGPEIQLFFMTKTNFKFEFFKNLTPLCTYQIEPVRNSMTNNFRHSWMHSSIAANFSNGRFVIKLFQDLKRGAGKIFFRQAHGESHFKSLGARWDIFTEHNLKFGPVGQFKVHEFFVLFKFWVAFIDKISRHKWCFKHVVLFNEENYNSMPAQMCLLCCTNRDSSLCDILIYCTRSFITRGLYTFYPIF